MKDGMRVVNTYEKPHGYLSEFTGRTTGPVGGFPYRVDVEGPFAPRGGPGASPPGSCALNPARRLAADDLLAKENRQAYTDDVREALTDSMNQDWRC